MKTLIAILLVCFLGVVTAFTAFPAKAQYYLTTITNPWTFQEEVTFQKSIDVASTTIDINDVDVQFSRTTSLNAASTTACAARGPVAGTSTMDFMANIDVSSTTAATWTLALSGTASATSSASTTPIQSFTTAANGKGFFRNASSTVVAPGQWVVLTAQGGNGTFSPTGVCTMIFTGGF